MPPEETPPTTPETPPADPVTPPAETPADPPLGDAGTKALEAMKERARVAEKAVKAHEAELEKLRNAAMSDQEKAVSEAEARGRQTALTEAGRKIAVAEIRAAAVGKDTEALNSQLEFLNVDTVLGEDGEVDAEKVARFVAGVADSGKPAVPGVPIGARQMPTEPSLADQLAEAQAKGDTKRFIQLQSGQLTRLPIPK